MAQYKHSEKTKKKISRALRAFHKAQSSGSYRKLKEDKRFPSY